MVNLRKTLGAALIYLYLFVGVALYDTSKYRYTGTCGVDIVLTFYKIIITTFSCEFDRFRVDDAKRFGLTGLLANSGYQSTEARTLGVFVVHLGHMGVFEY